ncbi:hypothetical protein LQ384_23325 [Rhodococcus rhodochrous]|uniref:Restriction endonuclease subunit S n=1 Tax=Rhodococcus rhodochrous TaxID=1829 RepID=A0AAW4XM00_RHORH|nr:hypothetical protein [Rhodococcus rhodochrous]MCD2114051.1 hypothetical protein [Rhodococcus rhodochrous]
MDYAPLSVTKHGVVPQMANVAKTGNNTTRKLVRTGDFVINSRSDRKGSAGLSALDGSTSNVYTVLRPRASIDGRFVHHLLRSRAFQEEFYRWGNGIVADLWSTRYSSMKRIALAVPPLEEQRVIADYLDRETVRIDTLIEEQQRLIELLYERRAAVLSAAFDSGPATQSTKVGHLLAARPSYGVLVPKYVDEAEGVPFVRVGDLLNLDPERPMMAIAPEQSDEYSRTKLAGGEVLLGVVGKMGQAALAPNWLAGANVARAVAVLRCKDPGVAPLLCAWFGSNNFLNQAELATSGDSIQPTLGMKDLAHFDINLPLGPNAAADIASNMANIDTLIAETEQFIELSKERRAALITAAVTGKIDVREMV